MSKEQWTIALIYSFHYCFTYKLADSLTFDISIIGMKKKPEWKNCKSLSYTAAASARNNLKFLQAQL